MPSRRSYHGPPKLVMAFDIGTTYSGVSYCILVPYRAPEVLEVARFPAQGEACAEARVPSLVYYDKSGAVRAAGAEALTQNMIQTAQTEGWRKAEWWKLHLCPSDLSVIHDIPPLPSGKSVVDVLTDFIKYLFHCCKTYIQEHHPALTWSSVEDSIEYILTYPSGWHEQQYLYRQAIQRAGLVSTASQGQPRVYMLTEGEACLQSCLTQLVDGKMADQATPRGVVIVDAGGGIIDLSMFSVTVTPKETSSEVIAPAECRPQGSIFVTCRAKALMERKLEGWEQSSVEAIARYTLEFDQATKLVIGSDQKPAYIKISSRRTHSSRHCVLSGELKLSGQEATGLFGDSVDALIDMFENQKKHTAIPITIVFLLGGLSTNEWVRSRLRAYFSAKGIKIHQTDHDRKVLANGALSSHIDHHSLVKPRAASFDLTEQDLWALKEKYAYLERDLLAASSVVRAFERLHHCEAQVHGDHIAAAAESLIDLVNSTCEVARSNQPFSVKLAELTRKCALKLETQGDEALRAAKHDEAIKLYSSVLSLTTSTAVLDKWARIMLKDRPANDALNAAGKFKQPKFVTGCAICDILAEGDHVTEAITCYQQMHNELAGDTRWRDKRAQWEPSFLRHCIEKLEKQGDDAVNSRKYHVAVKRFSTILSLNPPNRLNILVKRSKARASLNAWEEALSDANEVIKLYPSCYRGYDLKHAALHGMKRYPEAVEAFVTMRAKPGVDITKYVDARPTIRRVIEETLHHMPQVVIDTASGRLYDRQQQSDAFVALPVYNELVSSMTRKLDRTRITSEVKNFYQYVMLSHRWEYGELRHQEVKNISIYDLQPSPANTKLRMFCLRVRSLGFRWAWSDNTCVDRGSNVVLQESLVAMFTWYRGSSLTIVYLRGVSSKSQLPGGLSRSIWNTRAWTYQEYVAPPIIQFYTEDWKPYFSLELFNHKESPAIIAEMQQATGVSAEEMAILRPGRDRVREKLYLASRREATLVEDIAYSLFGIFDIALPVIYGERTNAVGRLLENILTGSGDVTVLAWTGNAGGYNSCLPNDLAVYNPLIPPHVPRPIEQAEMHRIITALRSSLGNLALAKVLHHNLTELQPPMIAAKRLRLPGILFPLTDFAPDTESAPIFLHAGALSGAPTEVIHASNPTTPVKDLCVYRATASAFGDVEVKTADDLTGKSLCLVHPWIRPLLDQEFAERANAPDETTQALRIVARLRQPFGALLFEQLSRVEYRRVATDSLIMVQILEDVSLDQLIRSIRTIEVL